MKYKLAQTVGLCEPVDGYTKEEEVLERLLADATIQALYAKLPTSRMKAIVALHFELGYPQEVVAQMFQITQPTLVDEIKVIKKVLLGHKYKPTNRTKVGRTVAPEVIEKVAYLLSLP